MVATEFQALPWPALLLDPDGALVAASAATGDLLGFVPTDLATLEDRVQVLGDAGVLAGEALPWRRAAAGARFTESEIWIEHRSGRRVELSVEGRSLGGQRILALHGGAPPLARRSEAFLRALNAAVVARPDAVAVREILRELVRHACDVTGARYGALGVLDETRAALKDFVHVGIDDGEARRIGALPAGHGLLGAVIAEARTIRVARAEDDPRAAGVPPAHPRMGAFLGVPLRIGAEVFGNFYLARAEGEGEFDEEDAATIEGLAAHAALTVAFARQARDEQRRLFETLVQHAPHAIAYFPADRAEEVYRNPAADRLLGLITRSEDPARGYVLAYPDGAPVAPHDYPSARALRGESVLNVTFKATRPGAETPIQLLASAAPVRTAEGAILGAVLVLQDVTAFVDLARLREEFASIVAHDLKTPVQSVLLQLERVLIRARGEDAVVPIATLERMRHSARRLSRLATDLLDASLIEAHRLRVNLAPVELAQLVPTLVEELRTVLGAREVAVEVAGAVPAVAADPLRLEQVLTNLVENAAKYSPAGTPIAVTVQAAGAGAEVAVRDEGPGIDPEDVPRLFDRYYQARRAREKASGSGLGLFIAKGLVDSHGGRLTVESTPGAGSVFRVWLPAAPA